MNYEKLTVERFVENMRDGKYETLTGARRAIGKTSSWSAKDKEQAHTAANKHFQALGPVKVAKAAKPAAKTATAAAPAKKQARKPIRKAPPPAPTATTPDQLVNEEVHASSAKKFTPSAGSASTTVGEAVGMGSQVIEFFLSARESLEFQQRVNPTGDFSKTLASMSDGLARAVSLVSSSLPPVNSIDTTLPPPRVSLPKETKPAPTVSASKPQAAPAAVTPAPVPAPTPTSPIFNGTGSPLTPSPVNAIDLSPEDQVKADALRNATPASTIAALPRPVSQPG